MNNKKSIDIGYVPDPKYLSNRLYLICFQEFPVTMTRHPKKKKKKKKKKVNALML